MGIVIIIFRLLSRLIINVVKFVGAFDFNSSRVAPQPKYVKVKA